MRVTKNHARPAAAAPNNTTRVKPRSSFSSSRVLATDPCTDTGICAAAEDGMPAGCEAAVVPVPLVFEIGDDSAAAMGRRVFVRGVDCGVVVPRELVCSDSSSDFVSAASAKAGAPIGSCDAMGITARCTGADDTRDGLDTLRGPGAADVVRSRTLAADEKGTRGGTTGFGSGARTGCVSSTTACALACTRGRTRPCGLYTACGHPFFVIGMPFASSVSLLCNCAMDSSAVL